MTDGSADVSRRAFLTATAGAGAAVGAAGTGAAQNNTTNQTGGNVTEGNATAGGNETTGNQTGGNQTGGNQTGGNETDGGGGGGGGEPDFGGFLDDAPYFGGEVVDMRGEDQPTVTVGVDGVNNARSFEPAAIHVDSGATVTWEWTGNGGAHNVVHDGGNFGSETYVEEGATFEHTFESDGIYNYLCEPHEADGMLGSVVVGSDYPTVDPEAGGEGPQPLPNSIKTLGVATLTTLVATLGLAYAFIKYSGSGPTE